MTVITYLFFFLAAQGRVKEDVNMLNYKAKQRTVT